MHRLNVRVNQQASGNQDQVWPRHGYAEGIVHRCRHLCQQKGELEPAIEVQLAKSLAATWTVSFWPTGSFVKWVRPKEQRGLKHPPRSSGRV